VHWGWGGGAGTLSDGDIRYLLQTGYSLGGIGRGNFFSHPITT
jgi:hypothetical protein